MFCSQCGKQLQENAAFCSFCGASTDFSDAFKTDECLRVIIFHRLNAFGGSATNWDLYVDDELVDILSNGSALKYEIFDSYEHTFYMVPQLAITAKGQIKMREKAKKKYSFVIPSGYDDISFDLYLKGSHPIAKRR